MLTVGYSKRNSLGHLSMLACVHLQVSGHMSMDELQLLEIAASAHLQLGSRESARDALQRCLAIAEMLSQHLSLARCLYALAKLADEERLEQAGVLDGVLAYFDAAPVDNAARALYEQCLVAGKKIPPAELEQQAQVVAAMSDAARRLGRDGDSGNGSADETSECRIS